LQKILEVALPAMQGTAAAAAAATTTANSTRSSSHTPSSAIDSGVAVSPDAAYLSGSSTKTPTSTASCSGSQHFPQPGLQGLQGLSTVGRLKFSVLFLRSAHANLLIGSCILPLLHPTTIDPVDPPPGMSKSASGSPPRSHHSTTPIF